MNVFVQGMRRSGTTILFDLFWGDGRFRCWYEPFTGDKPAMGGGSGVREVDYFADVRTAREQFAAAGGVASADLLNYGAPRDPGLESLPDLPEYCRQYIRFLCDQGPMSFLKFTRLTRKVRVLAQIDPTAKFIHIVRDPRAVAASYLFGKGQKNRHRFRTPADFFGRVSDKSAWSSFPLSEALLAEPAYAGFSPLADFERVLLLWKDAVAHTFRDGREAFGNNYMLLRHEQLLVDGVGTLEEVFAFLGVPPQEHVLAWAKANVRPPSSPFAADDPAWARAFARLNMAEELTQAGYPELAARAR